MLEKRFKSIGLEKVYPERFDKVDYGGVYAIVFYIDKAIKLRDWTLTKGVYVYIGSAKRGLKLRLKRYVSDVSKKFWHIDFLLPYAKVLFAYVGDSLSESELALYTSNFYPSIENFGNTDDKNNDSHLFYVPPLFLIVKSLYEEGIRRNAPVYVALEDTKDPFERFIFVFLSSRTKDETTLRVTKNFVKRFKSWDEIRSSSLEEIERLLYGVAFYKQKSRNLKRISEMLSGREVPSSYDALVKLPGIGRKIAKVILADIFRHDIIGVDVHVHRISNRIGLIKTKTEEETDKKLNFLVPPSLKRKFNVSFVGYGQTICTPKNPKCSSCRIQEYCRFYVSRSF